MNLTIFRPNTPHFDNEWVRYGDDALLINLADGEIVQSMYGIFM